MPKKINWIGKKFGRLTVIDKLPDGKVLCRCECGKETAVDKNNLTNGHTKSCGCLKDPDRSGQRQGRLLLLEKYTVPNDHHTYYRCLCDCGRTVSIRTDRHTMSCGKCGMYDEKRSEAIKNCGEFVEGTQISKIESKPTAANKSGVVGVCWDKSRSKWQASIRFKGKKYNLGRFDKIQDAIDARKAAEEKFFKPILDTHKKGDEE